jgi:nucleotide-binding universal stress UspA family protein
MEQNFLERILIATDGSENAAKAVIHGINIAKTIGADVQALYIISTEHAVATRTVMGWTDSFEKYLEEIGKEALSYATQIGERAGVKVKPVFRKGRPAEEILEYAEENNIGLIIMGTQGLTGIKKFLIGSVTEKVLRHSKVPVMIVR